MKERGIALCNDLVLATLEDRKTKTRRVVTPQPKRIHAIYNDASLETERLFETGDQRIHCPHGAPGDRLYVKEGYRIIRDCTIEKIDGYKTIHCVTGCYKADQQLFEVLLTEREWGLFAARKYRYRGCPGRFMYKSLARIWLEIVSVRVERVQDITEEDAIAEGVEPIISGKELESFPPMVVPAAMYTAIVEEPHRTAFRSIWDKLNGKRGYDWDSNCWIWVIEYRRITL